MSSILFIRRRLTRSGEGNLNVMRALVLVCLLLTGCGLVEAPASPGRADCVLPREVASIGFSATKYPNIRRHYEAAVADGWPRVLVLRRAGADERRSRALAHVGTRAGMDRDEYPPAIGRSSGRASVAFVPSSENRSHGATLGIKLRRYCDGTRFRYVFY